jgi:hypothetical protein
MSGINVGRWLAGGVVAGIIIWILEGAASLLYFDDMKAAMERHTLSMEMSAGMWVASVVVSLIVGLALVFFYAASRPRFGAGPKTAILIAVALWIAGYLVSLLGYAMLGLFPTSMLVLWGVVSIVEMIVASLAGAWIYREPASAPAAAAQPAMT